MKKILIALFLIVSVVTTESTSASAITCADCKKIWQGVKDLIDSVVINASTLATNATTKLDWMNKNVLIPVNSVLAMQAVLASKQGIQALVYGTVGQDNALLITNPRKYLDGKVNSVVQVSVGNVVSQNGIYSNSIASELIASSKYNNASLKNKLSGLNQSSIPSLVQKQVCADEVLSVQAQRDTQGPNGERNQEAYTKRKKELYDNLCGDVGDKKIQQNLMAYNKQNPGFDSFLAITSGENEFTKVIRAQTLVNQEADIKKEFAATDLDWGKGIRSVTECTKRTETDVSGEPYESNDLSAPCIDEEIKKTAASLSKLFEDSFDMVKPILSTVGSFSGPFSALIGTGFQTISLLNSANNMVSGGSTGGGGGSNQGQITGSGGGVQDLKNNPTAKENVIGTPLNFLKDELVNIDKLGPSNARYIAAINKERDAVREIKQCFETLIDTYPEAFSDSRVVKARNYYTPLTSNTTDARIVAINNENVLLNEKKILVNETITKIQNSNSSEEISSIFNTFQKTDTAKKYPVATQVIILREADIVKVEGGLEANSTEGGILYNFKSDCTNIRAELSRVNAY